MECLCRKEIGSSTLIQGKKTNTFRISRKSSITISISNSNVDKLKNKYSRTRLISPRIIATLRLIATFLLTQWRPSCARYWRDTSKNQRPAWFGLRIFRYYHSISPALISKDCIPCRLRDALPGCKETQEGQVIASKLKIFILALAEGVLAVENGRFFYFQFSKSTDLQISTSKPSSATDSLEFFASCVLVSFYMPTMHYTLSRNGFQWNEWTKWYSTW